MEIYGMPLVIGNAGFRSSTVLGSQKAWKLFKPQALYRITIVPKPFALSPGPKHRKNTKKPKTYLWLVGIGRMVAMVLIIVPIPPFPTNQR